ncbi:pyridoxal phosphate-dependent decarboxylase family protein [Nitriliruptor alkaliphilus]|uniref:pyridoxal phosphate-dependent decarboxylase family protein n=1 Tax=Nitriliruptor alkaliphilus TaxID=427918 RepID=UPI00069630ED|nr:aspartate aminotransferase family protein [Nitriliruptor alkaliphilus]
MSVPIPEHGTDRGRLLGEVRAAASGDVDWHGGRTFSLVYHHSDEHQAFLEQVVGSFLSTNALNPLAFQSLRRFEAEVVAMTAWLLGGDDGAAGTMSSGGTESIILAVKAYRDRARRVGRLAGGATPNLVLPVTAHPAFLKACHLLDVEPRLIEVAPELGVDVTAAAERVDAATIAVVGSAPNYPYGVIDPIPELAALAQQHDVGCHVDACLGGFLLPWVERLGRDVPPWDFRVPGVTSISADLHKYGFTAKGASVIVYRDAALRRHQFQVETGWPGGVWLSPTIAGTRPGGAIAGAWATLHAFGVDGYLDLHRGLLETTDVLRKGIDDIDGLAVLGDPPAGVFAVGSSTDEVDAYAVADAMEARGWHPDRLLRPPALHVMVTPVHADGVADRFLADLADSVEEVRGRPELSTQGQAAMYGMVATLPEGEHEPAEEFLLGLIDGLYEV